MNKIYLKLFDTMAASGSSTKMEAKEVMNIQLISTRACEPPIFRAIPKITYKANPNGALSQITPNILMIHDVRDFYTSKIGEVGDYELREAYAKLCDNGVLKDEFKIAKTKKLPCAINFP